MVKHKLKAVLPSLREKKRYLAFEIISDKKIRNFSSLSDSIWGALLDFLGILNGSKAGIWVLPDKWNEHTQRGLIKVSNNYVEHLKSALMFIKRIENEEVIFRSIAVSGGIKKISSKILN